MNPLFLFTGPEIGERNDAIATLRTQIEKKSGSLDYYTMYAADTKVSEVVSLLQSGSLFASVRFVVLRNAEEIKLKSDIDLINSWQKGAIKAGTEDSFLFLVSDEIGVDKKLENIVAKDNKKIFWEMLDGDKNQWLRNYFRRNNFSIEDDAIESILDLIENNTESLRNECSRFFSCFEQGHTVTSNDVEKILAHNREESPFTLFDAMSDATKTDSARLDSALSILQKIKQSKDSSYVPLIAGLAYCFRSLRSYHALYANNNRPTDIDLRNAGFSGKKRQAQYRNAAKIWNDKQTAECLSLLADSDIKIRSNGASIEETVLQTMLYSIVMKRGQPLIEYQANSIDF